MDEKEVTNVTQEEIVEFYSKHSNFEDLDDLDDLRRQCLDRYLDLWLCSKNTRDEEGFLNYLKKDSDDIYRDLSDYWPGSSNAAIVNSGDFKKYFHEYYEQLIWLYGNFDSLEDERKDVLSDYLILAKEYGELDDENSTVEGLVSMLIKRVYQTITISDFEKPHYHPFLNEDHDEYDFMDNYLTTEISYYREP